MNILTFGICSAKATLDVVKAGTIRRFSFTVTWGQFLLEFGMSMGRRHGTVCPTASTSAPKKGRKPRAAQGSSSMGTTQEVTPLGDASSSPSPSGEGSRI